MKMGVIASSRRKTMGFECVSNTIYIFVHRPSTEPGRLLWWAIARTEPNRTLSETQSKWGAITYFRNHSIIFCEWHREWISENISPTNRHSSSGGYPMLSNCNMTKIEVNCVPRHLINLLVRGARHSSISCERFELFFRELCGGDII